ncbi:MAG: phosphoribosylformylglycinamidine cyclo-ligase [candidate division WOR-3 bacterium]|nr:phosphoribosylformylglycinamidine cyclo-ligase [candidate division WOR-3 bacterium]
MLYRDSGVDVNKANEILKGIKPLIQKTHNKFVLNSLGYFGAAFQVPSDFKNPVLVSSIDGIGTKILIAIEANSYEGIGEDIVNHCVNDILTMGAKPLYVLDYFACGKLEEEVITPIIQGMIKSCDENECSLIGGETAEMPSMYRETLFDLAAQITGIVEKDRIIDGTRIREGDKVFGLPSSGFHTNGYSLIRSIIYKANISLDDYIPELEGPLGEILLRPHRSYYKEIFPHLDSITGLSHITGGGFFGNIPRILPEGLSCYIDSSKWEVPAPFKFIGRIGKVPEREMFSVFNMGIGMVVIGRDLDIGFEVGEIQKGNEPIIVNGI